VECPFVLGLDDPRNLVFVLFLGHYQVVLRSHLALHANLERSLAPPTERFLYVCVFEHVVQIFADPFSVFVKEPFSGGHPNASEHFNTQGPAGDRADDIDGVFFSAHVVTPSVENVSSFLNVHVVLYP
jgi:hypothetical protein